MSEGPNDTVGNTLSFIEWVATINGLGTVIVAIFVGFFIWRQTKTAENAVKLEGRRVQHDIEMSQQKRRHELFDRRFPMYESARKFLSVIVTDGRANEGDIEEFRLEVIGADFLFDSELRDYLFGLRETALKANMKERQEKYDEQSVLISELANELIEGKLYEKFKPFMSLG